MKAIIAGVLHAHKSVQITCMKAIIAGVFHAHKSV
jgi:hypothetical protein